jgi:hypothetical protein
MAYCLHPHLPTALRITREALFERFAVLGATQHKRQRQYTMRRNAESQAAAKPSLYKLPLTRQELLQASIYAISEVWERDQEQQSSRNPNNIYRPTREDLLVRYVKLLIARTMDRPALYAALSLGCQLYQYSPSTVVDLAPEVFPAANARRIHGYLHDWIKDRFPILPLRSQPPYGETKVETTTPTSQERQLIYDALARFTPWSTPHLRRGERRFAPLLSLFGASTCAGKALLKLEAKRIHALIDPQCAGFEVLVRAYNAAFSSDHKADTMSVGDPYDKLALPVFPHDNDQAPPSGERFNPPRLSPEALLILQDAMREQQQRRRQYRPGLLQVRVDGKIQAHFDPREGPCPPVYVPFSASAVEVYGEDNVGALLLAVFPLAVLFGGEADSVLRMTHASGHTFELAVAASAATLEDTAEGCMVRLTHTEAPPPLLARLWEGMRSQWHRVETGLQRLFVHPGIPTVATALGLLLVVSNLWLSGLLQGVRGPHEGPVWRGGHPSSTVSVMLAFRSSSTELEIRRFLQEMEGHVVDGPLTGPEDGYYRVELPLRSPDPAPSDAERTRLEQDVLSRLQQAELVRDAVLVRRDRPARPAQR